MNQALSEEWQQVAANGVIHEAGQAFQCMASEASDPHVLMRPAISIDGNKWCALYGENPQDGVAGFGDSPAQAMADFDKNWFAKLSSADKGSAAGGAK